MIKNLSKKEIDLKFCKLMSALKEEKVHEMNLEISVDIVIGTKDNNLLDTKKIMKTADVCLYDSKNNGKNQYNFSK